MPSVTVIRESPLVQTPRVLQVSSMYDIPAAERSRLEWTVDLPLHEQDWNIGLIVGPSGSGKTSIAKDLFPNNLFSSFEWDSEKSVVDSFPNLSIRKIIGYMTSVGFSSPPSWLRPFHVLSNGEQFRVTLARVLATGSDLLVFDEFTSVVDRQVAQIASHSLQKVIRREKRHFIALSCHYDIIGWLQPDWIYEPQSNLFQWRSLQRRPTFDLKIYELDKSAWKLFRNHHYLSNELHTGAQCFGAYLNDQLIAFNSYLHFPHPRTKRIKMGHRLVVLPDYQGIGIGGAFDDWLGHYLWTLNFEYRNTIAHPALLHHYSNSDRWKLVRTAIQSKTGQSGMSSMKHNNLTNSIKRLTSTFVYMEPSKDENS